MSTVILGTGIIGLSTAYYLSQSQLPSTIHLVEPSPTLFASASGFAGGFLAKDWFASPVAALGALSFDEHAKLAKLFDGKRQWGYARSTTVSYTPGKKRSKKKTGNDIWFREGGSRVEAASGAVQAEKKGDEGPLWLNRGEGDSLEMIGEEDSTAIVDPRKLCHFLLNHLTEKCVILHHPAKASSLHYDIRNELSGVRILSTNNSTQTDVPCTRLLIAAGAWSPEVFCSLFPSSPLKIPISSLAGHSLLVRSPRWSDVSGEGGAQNENAKKPIYAIYTSETAYSPELYARVGGEIYIAGVNSSFIPLPNIATASRPQQSSISQLKETANNLLANESDKNDLEVLREGLCFRPVTERGTPILTRIEDRDLGNGKGTRGGGDGGVWLAAGHGPWGITLSLGTGKVMAEMMIGNRTSADVQELGA